MSVEYTKKELAEFDALSWRCSSQDQMTRIQARTDMKAFVGKHGKEKCDAMWAVLQTADAERAKRGRRK